MSEGLRVVGASRASKTRRRPFKTSRPKVPDTQATRHDMRDEHRETITRPGSLMLQIPFFTFVFVPRSHRREE